jgi:hypothetical protein
MRFPHQERTTHRAFAPGNTSASSSDVRVLRRLKRSIPFLSFFKNAAGQTPNPASASPFLRYASACANSVKVTSPRRCGTMILPPTPIVARAARLLTDAEPGFEKCHGPRGKTPQGSQARRVASGATHAVRAIRQHEKPRRCSASKNWAGSVKMISKSRHSVGEPAFDRQKRGALPCPPGRNYPAQQQVHGGLMLPPSNAI